MENWQEQLRQRVKNRCAQINRRAERFIRQIDAGRADRGIEHELERQWLESLVQEKGSNGLNLCCGNYSIGDSYGVDINGVLAADIVLPVDKLDRLRPNCFDYIISNHIESAENALKVFDDIYHILNPGGMLALVCHDVDAEVNSAPNDSIMNSYKKVTVFSKNTMRRYLLKVGFFEENIKITEGASPRFFRVVAYKDA